MRHGTQTVERAVRLVVELARRSTGWRLTELAREAGLDVATAHRMLACLADAGLAARRADRHFVVGPELFNLGLAAQYHTAFVDAARSTARDTAARTSLVAFVYLQAQNDFVCVARAGRTAFQGLSVQVGTRRPLLVSAGGLAMLVRMDARERRAIVNENLLRIRAIGRARSRAAVQSLQESLAAGYGLNRGHVVPGLTAVGVAARLPHPWTQASVLVTGPSDALPERRLDATAEMLAAAVEALQARAPQRF